jgi:UDP-glucose 4-epimerase
VNVLVTGGLGVNGAWVVRDLLAQGHRVVALDVRRDFRLLPDLAERVAYVDGDVLDLRGLLRTVQEHRIDAVAHLAARIMAERDPYDGALTNTLGSLTVLEAARLGGVRRFVFTSSKAVYAPAAGVHGPPQYRPVTEDYPFGVTATWRIYGSSKIHVEAIGTQYAEVWGLEFIALRFGTIFGPGKQERHGPIGIHGRMIEGALRGDPVRFPQGGDQVDDIIYVKDVAQGIVRALLAPAPPHRVFNIGSGAAISYRDFAAAVRTAIPGADVEIGPGLDPVGVGAQTYHHLDITRARAELGYAPAYDAVRGILDYAGVLRTFGLA